MLHSPEGAAKLIHWSAYLRTLAGEAAAASLTLDEARSFRDDRGHHRALDLPFFAHRFGHDPGRAPAHATHDTALWWALHDREINVDAVLDKKTQHREGNAKRSTFRGGKGGLFHQDLFQTIEVWTEADLAGLHALFHLAHLRGRADWRSRTFEVARWHVEEVQPDNGTNHPWAAHVFLILAAREHDAQAQLHAETLLSNCLVTLGRPDALSRHILADAALALDAYIAET